MARRVSALVTVTAASSGSCPSLEFVSFHRRKTPFHRLPLYTNYLYKIFVLFDLKSRHTLPAMLMIPLLAVGKMSILEQEAD